MSKQNKKLQQEITSGLKQMEEGIAQLEVLEAKVENASTISIKEKYRQDMKREIKRLQRLRDIFRQNTNNPIIIEQHRLVDARKRIETEMEKFRDHEKEYKQKRPTKAAMQNETEIKGKFNYGSGSSFDGEYGDETADGVDGSDDDLGDDGDAPDINLDKQWLGKFTLETLKAVIGKYDTELDKIQNKKTKGGQKKNRDKINALKAKKSHLQHIKDRAEELQISMDYIEAGKIRQLRLFSKQLSQNSDEEPVRTNVLNEIDSLIEQSEQNRRAMFNPSSSGADFRGGAQGMDEDGRSVLENLDVAGSHDVVTSVQDLNALRVGNILDAQDYLGSWHLAIVIAEDAASPDSRTLHFLPFQKANRDEVFGQDDMARLAPAFSKQEESGEPQSQIGTLRIYLEAHQKKHGVEPTRVSRPTNTQEELKVPTGSRNLANSAQAASRRGAPQDNEKGRVNAQSSKQKRVGANQRPLLSYDNWGSSDQAETDTMNSGQVANRKAEESMGQRRQEAESDRGFSNNPKEQSERGGVLLQKGKQSRLSHQTGANFQPQKQDGLPSSSPKLDRPGQARGKDDQSAHEDDSLPNGAGKPSQRLDGESINGRSLPKTESTQQQQDLMQRPEFSAIPPLFQSNFGSLGEHPSAIDQASGSSDRKLSQPNDLSSQGGLLLQNPMLGPLGAMGQQPQLVKDTSSSERKHNLELLEASFLNILTKQDQEVIDPKHPVSVWEEHDFPRVPLYNRKEDFSKFDLETLFFAFYYQQGTYQQYLAAVELKKKNWKFVKKFETWFKKVEGEPGTQPRGSSSGPSTSGPSDGTKGNTGAAQKDVGKYIFFDFENGWQQLVRDDFELDLSLIENELVVQPAGGSAAGSAASGAPTRAHPQ